MVGTTISHYKVLEKIGEGGMCEVYRATDTRLNRDVALRLDKGYPDLCGHELNIKSFREANHE